jgi:hypothetical protein
LFEIAKGEEWRKGWRGERKYVAGKVFGKK